jgi:hypothetical protein
MSMISDDGHRRVAGHRFGFFRREPPRLQQHLVRHADLADVVQQRGNFQRVPLRRIELHHCRPRAAAKRHPYAVRRGGWIFAAQSRVQPASNSQPGVNELGLVRVGQDFLGRAAALRRRVVKRLQQRGDFRRPRQRISRRKHRHIVAGFWRANIGGVIGHVASGLQRGGWQFGRARLDGARKRAVDVRAVAVVRRRTRNPLKT